jgi:hypothetical protein
MVVSNHLDNQVSQSFSFYSDDSFEYVHLDLQLKSKSRFKNIHKVLLPPLDFTDLPEYETTEDEEEEGDNLGDKDEREGEQVNYEDESIGMNSPSPCHRVE